MPCEYYEENKNKKIYQDFHEKNKIQINLL